MYSGKFSLKCRNQTRDYYEAMAFNIVGNLRSFCDGYNQRQCMVIHCLLNNVTADVFEDRPCEEGDFSERLETLPGILNNVIKYLETADNLQLTNNSRQSSVVLEILKINAENDSLQPWNNAFIINISKNINQLMCKLLGKSCISEVLLIKKENEFYFEMILKYLQPSLCKSKWRKHVTAIDVFKWTVLQVTYPNLSRCFEIVFPVILNLLDDFVVANQVSGIIVARHILNNVLISELRAFNRIDVLLDGLKVLLVSRDCNLVNKLLPCLLKTLQVKSPLRINYKDEQGLAESIFESMLNCIELATDVNLKISFLQAMPDYFEFYNHNLLVWCGRIVSILTQLLEVCDTALSILTLKAMESLLTHCWPCAEFYCLEVLQSVFKLIIDLSTDETTDSAMSNEIKILLRTLDQLCPDTMCGVRKGFQNIDWPGKSYLYV